MIRSMTGYARIQKQISLGNLAIEIYSVNRKGLDINISMPRMLLWFDSDIRNLIQSKVERGAINLTISIDFFSSSQDFTLQTLNKIKNYFEDICQKLGLNSKDNLNLQFLLEQLEKEDFSADIDVAPLREELTSVLDMALEKFLSMKEHEGKALFKDISNRLEKIKEELSFIEKNSDKAVALHREKIGAKLKELQLLDEDRLMREVAFYAEKLDITEELTRLKSHLEQVDKLFSSKDVVIGRNLEFLVQEMFREANTICAKCSDADIIRAAIFIKGELDKIKEQTRNIE